MTPNYALDMLASTLEVWSSLLTLPLGDKETHNRAQGHQAALLDRGPTGHSSNTNWSGFPVTLPMRPEDTSLL